ncbi:MAG: hypothetical protein ACEQSA_06490 [Weeksellaceae bacterium]
MSKIEKAMVSWLVSNNASVNDVNYPNMLFTFTAGYEAALSDQANTIVDKARIHMSLSRPHPLELRCKELEDSYEKLAYAFDDLNVNNNYHCLKIKELEGKLSVAVEALGSHRCTFEQWDNYKCLQCEALAQIRKEGV